MKNLIKKVIILSISLFSIHNLNAVNVKVNIFDSIKDYENKSDDDVKAISRDFKSSDLVADVKSAIARYLGNPNQEIIIVFPRTLAFKDTEIISGLTRLDDLMENGFDPKSDLTAKNHLSAILKK